MMASHFHRQAILDIAKMFNATVEDIGSEAIILEIVSWSARVDAFIIDSHGHAIIWLNVLPSKVRQILYEVYV